MNTTASPSPAARTAALMLVLHTAGLLGDYGVQTDPCARRKGAHDDEPVVETDEDGAVIARHGSAAGRRACAHHVATYTATQAAAVLAANKALRLGLRPGRIALALGVSAATHYVADRRRPLRRLADVTGKGKFYRMSVPGMSGAVELDQMWHRVWEALAAVLAGR